MKKAYKVIILCMFVVCIGFILFLSGQNGNEAFYTTYEIARPIADLIYENPNNDQIEDVMIVVRNFGRVAAFTVFGILLALAVDILLKRSWKVKVIIIVALTILFSVFDEVHKLAIEGRHCTLEEIVVNIICSMTAGLMVCFIRYKMRCKL